MPSETEIVKRIIKRYGETINLKTSPHTMIEILRAFALEDNGDGGLPPGGTPPPPGPAEFGGGVRLEEVMAEVLKLSRAVNKLSRQLKT
ncbi:MAG: hypothetical protein ACREDI_04180 [Roseiarcus sp.]